MTERGRWSGSNTTNLLTMKRGKGMRTRNTRRVAALAAAVLGAGLALASCADDDKGGDAASGTWPGADKTECKDLEQLADFGDLSGKDVGVYLSLIHI